MASNELRVQLNVRVNNDLNLSVSFTHVLLDSDADIEAAGHEDARAFSIYMRGYSAGATSINEESP